MSQAVLKLNSLVNKLSESDVLKVCKYIEITFPKQKSDDMKLFDEIHSVMSKNKPWENEETLIKDLAEFRRSYVL